MQRTSHLLSVQISLQGLVTRRKGPGVGGEEARVVHDYLLRGASGGGVHHAVEEGEAHALVEASCSQLAAAVLLELLQATALSGGEETQPVREVRDVVLVEGVHPRIAQRDAFQIYVHQTGTRAGARPAGVPLEDVRRHDRDVMAGVGLAGDEEGARTRLGRRRRRRVRVSAMKSEEILEEAIEVGGNGLVILREAVADSGEGKARPDRLVDEQEVRVLMP